ncbi:4Fe-4S dicluster domain-containing protein [Desulfopila sp. IMCC35006]|uniref:4Fe-4S dicluster domain-containing protein n=1 Tax=Desulfopila sp. IMCC35006 TaxID=2569542 RepID=UPI0010AB99F0|nr:4Fe-4S dicluster domain-containing protein [Desulfopila sp. IMCC35006]TKB27540.1 4Fe-4S dicluster domain-containing protein [Desulfopila sp. IMCC35006]
MQGLLKLIKKSPILPGVSDYDPVIRQVEDPDRVVVPLDYPGRVRYFPTVEAGETVRKGQVIGKSRLGNCAFATISGTVRNMTSVWTAQSIHSPAIVIENDGGQPLSPEEIFDGPVAATDKEAVVARMRAAGVNPPWTFSGRDYSEGAIEDIPSIKSVIITGVRQETTVLTSQLLLQQEAEKVADGLQRIRTLLPDVRLWLTVPEHLRLWAEPRFSQLAELAFLPDNYSARIEREVVAKLLGRRIPSRESYRSHGIAVMDLEYVLATVDALDGVSPFMQKCLTISGEGIDKAVTVRFPLGTSLRHILASQGLNASDYTRQIVGGPMMGFAQYSDKTPITYNNGIFLITSDVKPFDAIAPCIFCGRCTRVCPVNIQVHMLNRMIEFGRLDSTAELHPEACHECGLCAHVCPAERPIVQLLHFCNHEMSHGERFNWTDGGNP